MGLQVDAIADFICPWCYLGKSRLEKALTHIHGDDQPRVMWHPFQLNPDMPVDGISFDEYLDKRFGGRELVQPFLDEITAVGEKEGIIFRFDQLERVPNTLNAHRLIQIAGPGPEQNRLVDLLFRNFFEHGRDIGDKDLLCVLGKEAGLDAAAIHRIQRQDGALKEVRAEEEHLRKLGVSGVPNFILNGKYAVAGAQDSDALVQVFDQVMFDTRANPMSSSRVH
jgi:predicted DsbA family dithiol-disulfide isomerase